MGLSIDVWYRGCGVFAPKSRASPSRALTRRPPSTRRRALGRDDAIGSIGWEFRKFRDRPAMTREGRTRDASAVTPNRRAVKQAKMATTPTGARGCGGVEVTPPCSAAPFTPGPGREAGSKVETNAWTPETPMFGPPKTVDAREGTSRKGIVGGFDSPERARGTADANEAVYGTPPASPRATARENVPLACPATPIKARRTRGVCFAGENESAARPRGRVVRSLLEEFNAAARELDDMLEEKSENTIMQTFDDGFDPFDEPE
ncbi:hypothetical protein BE221DRAFT_172430 [Ostreococcus tauri]|uniref:Uncharacterized protein n=1 Tax=Ostreococcus tauri TaxID=70448 RepID=A0A1Y5IGD6_OSTTA|nr:hypothetical protein BE221DRAFT_172430 [Ostreococcus tauri]